MSITSQPELLRFYPSTENSEKLTPINARMCSIRWRLTEKQKAAGMKAKPTAVIYIPSIKLSIHPSILEKVVREAFESMQDTMIQAWLTSEIAEKASYGNNNWNYLGTSIPVNLTTPEGIALLANEETESSRLSVAKVGAWFEENLIEPLLAALVEKNNNLTDVQMANAVEQYKKLICSLSSPRSMMAKEKAEAVRRAIHLSPVKDRIFKSLDNVLEKFINPPTQEELEAIL